MPQEPLPPQDEDAGGPGEPLQPHGDPLLAAATGNPQGDGSRHGYRAAEHPEESDGPDEGES